ncbi:NfeD family protein [Geobacter sp. SVR]|uniref:NfeD family protein n=1 Tax=Geobacter sp. SVR TaxID=2495594 RepID=UPI00143F04F3|nr:NfeD family protein [Geobacter sp. SVR]BCS54601.1 DUF107 domain-containing protein [Geobacter sp. SVR]GCF86892.1 membrane protein [Geobacter sp. SVR]
MQLEWWYWIIAGFCLIGLELVIPSFTIIWFGIGALAVGVLKAFWPGFPAVGQILLWAAASISFSLMWFKYLKPKNNRVNAGIFREGVVGETGIIVRRADGGTGRWIVRLRIPVSGAEEWVCYSDEALRLDDTVRVEDMEGQILRVNRI